MNQLLFSNSGATWSSYCCGGGEFHPSGTGNPLAIAAKVAIHVTVVLLLDSYLAISYAVPRTKEPKPPRHHRVVGFF